MRCSRRRSKSAGTSAAGGRSSTYKSVTTRRRSLQARRPNLSLHLDEVKFMKLVKFHSSVGAPLRPRRNADGVGPTSAVGERHLSFLLFRRLNPVITGIRGLCRSVQEDTFGLHPVPRIVSTRRFQLSSPASWPRRCTNPLTSATNELGTD